MGGSVYSGKRQFEFFHKLLAAVTHRRGTGQHGWKTRRKLCQIVFGRQEQITFIYQHQHRNVFLGGPAGYRLFPVTPYVGLGHKNGHIGPVENFVRLGSPEAPQLRVVVHPGSVKKSDRAYGQKLHAFLHHIGGGARRRGCDGHLLSGYHVQHAGLAHIHPPEQGQLKTHGFWGFFHTGSGLPFK